MSKNVKTAQSWQERFNGFFAPHSFFMYNVLPALVALMGFVGLCAFLVFLAMFAKGML